MQALSVALSTKQQKPLRALSLTTRPTHDPTEAQTKPAWRAERDFKGPKAHFSNYK